MNKLEKLHEEVINKDIEDFNDYSETTYTTDNSLEEIKAYECSIITKDIAIKFVGFYNKKMGSVIVGLDFNELFNKFLETL